MNDLIDRRLLRLDVEFGNVHGFFSAARDWAKNYRPGATPFCRYEARIRGASLEIQDEAVLSPIMLERRVVFRAQEPSSLFDFVSRFVVSDLGGGRPSAINGMQVPHVSSNLYHQYPAGQVVVPIGHDQWLRFSGRQEGMPADVFEHVFYVRDEPCTGTRDEHRWIVHHRIVATPKADRLRLRGCNPRFEGPVPAWANRLVPGAVQRRLFRIRERHFPNFPVMTVGENGMDPGKCVVLSTRVGLLSSRQDA